MSELKDETREGDNGITRPWPFIIQISAFIPSEIGVYERVWMEEWCDLIYVFKRLTNCSIEHVWAYLIFIILGGSTFIAPIL